MSYIPTRNRKRSTRSIINPIHTLARNMCDTVLYTFYLIRVLRTTFFHEMSARRDLQGAYVSIIYIENMFKQVWTDTSFFSTFFCKYPKIFANGDIQTRTYTHFSLKFKQSQLNGVSHQIFFFFFYLSIIYGCKQHRINISTIKYHLFFKYVSIDFVFAK